MEGDFYSRANQMKREMRRLWNRLDPWTIPLVTVMTLLSFYGFRFLGASQVYTVIAPYCVVTFHLITLSTIQTTEEQQGLSASFYRNLPRQFTAVYDARVLFYMGLALYYELVIALGILLKLGGDGIVPIYRVLPELMVLPFAAVLYISWYCSRQRNRWLQLLLTFGLTFGTMGAVFSLAIFSILRVRNNVIPPRVISLEIECVLAALILVPGIALYARIRSRQPELKGDGA